MRNNIYLKNSHTRRFSISIVLLLLLTGASELCAQSGQLIDAPLLTFTRGKLWHSLYFGKSGPGSFSNWAKIGIGLNWPGFDEKKIVEDIDGSPSYMAAGGLYVGCKKDKDSALTVEEWCQYAGSVSNEVTAKYIIKKHKKYSDNLGMMQRRSGGEEMIETVWEYNPNFPTSYEPQRQLPLRVTRRAHQWNGSMRDENYIIYEYVIKNISNELQAYKDSRKIVDTLYDFYAMFNYALNCNSRSWSVLYPNLTPGARNTAYTVDTTKLDYYSAQRRTMVYARAGDYVDDNGVTSVMGFGYSSTGGQKVKSASGKIYATGEWLAPGYAGLRLLASPPDKIRKKANAINKFAWSAADNNQDLGGPLVGRSGYVEAAYRVLADPTTAYNAVVSPSPTTGSRRMWTMMSLGPWDLLPGDSVVIAVAEIVDGIDYAKVTGPNMYKHADITLVNQLGRSFFEQTSDKAQFTYNHGLRHPVPPMAPEFKVSFFKGKQNFVANQVNWEDANEAVPDPDDGVKDFAGYRLYRSEYLPIGPWTLVADIAAGDTAYIKNHTYTYVDSLVEIGSSYYYALTAYDKGRSSWSVDPNVVFKETGSKQVPVLESSIFANRSVYPFVATLSPPDNLNNVLVVPNPFVIGAGSSQPGSSDVIQFVNIPTPSTIRIYTVRGDLVKTIIVRDGDGAIASWNQATDYGQFVTSGIYIYHLDSPLGKKIGKFAIVR